MLFRVSITHLFPQFIPIWFLQYATYHNKELTTKKNCLNTSAEVSVKFANSLWLIQQQAAVLVMTSVGGVVVMTSRLFVVIIGLVRLKQWRTWVSGRLPDRDGRQRRPRQRRQRVWPIRQERREEVRWRHRRRHNFRLERGHAGRGRLRGGAAGRRSSDSCCGGSQADRKRKLGCDVRRRGRETVPALYRTTSGGVVERRRRLLVGSVMRCVGILRQRGGGGSSVHKVCVERRVGGQTVRPSQRHSLSFVFHAAILKPNLH